MQLLGIWQCWVSTCSPLLLVLPEFTARRPDVPMNFGVLACSFSEISHESVERRMSSTWWVWDVNVAVGAFGSTERCHPSTCLHHPHLPVHNYLTSCPWSPICLSNHLSACPCHLFTCLITYLPVPDYLPVRLPPSVCPQLCVCLFLSLVYLSLVTCLPASITHLSVLVTCLSVPATCPYHQYSCPHHPPACPHYLSDYPCHPSTRYSWGKGQEMTLWLQMPKEYLSLHLSGRYHLFQTH